MSQVDAARKATEGLPDGDLYKITLVGAMDEGVRAEVKAVSDRLGGSKFFVKIIDETTVKLDERRLSLEKTLKGEFFRVVRELNVSEAEKGEILRYGLAALDGTEMNDD